MDLEVLLQEPKIDFTYDEVWGDSNPYGINEYNNKKDTRMLTRILDAV